MKKAKVIKRELSEQMLQEDFDDIEALRALVMVFLKEFATLKNVISDTVIINKAKELDIKFKNSLPDELSHYGVLFREVLLKEIPTLKLLMKW
jgi:hypothetical protein